MQQEPRAAKVGRGQFNKKITEELREAGQVARAASNSEYASVWTAWDIAPTAAATLATRVSETNALYQESVAGRGGRGASSAAKNAAEIAIIAAIRRVQAGARKKHDGHEAELRRYFVGVELDKNEGELTNIAQTLLTLAGEEPLPGVGAAQITALQEALSAWQNANDAQTDAGDTSEGDYAKVEADVVEIKKLRRAFQIAIDAEFPYSDPDHRATRLEFDLPPTRPFA